LISFIPASSDRKRQGGESARFGRIASDTGFHRFPGFDRLSERVWTVPADRVTATGSAIGGKAPPFRQENG